MNSWANTHSQSASLISLFIFNQFETFTDYATVRCGKVRSRRLSVCWYRSPAICHFFSTHLLRHLYYLEHHSNPYSWHRSTSWSKNCDRHRRALGHGHVLHIPPDFWDRHRLDESCEFFDSACDSNWTQVKANYPELNTSKWFFFKGWRFRRGCVREDAGYRDRVRIPRSCRRPVMSFK